MIDKTFGKKENTHSYYDRIGAYLIAVQNNKLAVVKTPKGYFLLGGKLEPQENHIACIKRECLEEIGYTVSVSNYICSAETYCIHSSLGYFHPVQYYYSGQILEQVTQPIEQDHSLEWISCNDIDGKFFAKQQEWAVKKYLSA